MYVNGVSRDIVDKHFSRSKRVEFYAGDKMIELLDNTESIFSESILPRNYFIEGMKLTINKRFNKEQQHEVCIEADGRPLESYVFTSGGLGEY